jgi:uncharacterized protein (TIGR02270 family)
MYHRTRLIVIQDILEEHFEALEFLWGQRQTALRSPAYMTRALCDLEERIEAHVQGLLVGGDQTVQILRAHLLGDDPLQAFAAAYPILRMNSETATRWIMEMFLGAEAGRLDGIRQALCHVPIDMISGQLQEAFAFSPALIAAAAAEVLACHFQLDRQAERLLDLMKDEHISVRRAAWRVVAVLDSVAEPLPELVFGSARPYEAALHDTDPAVRREAIWAAAWSRQPWLLEHCRKLSDHPSPEHWHAVLLLAILGKPVDIERIVAVGKASGLGLQRFHALGVFGHPAVVDALLDEIESEDARIAVAAAAAFTKITGATIDADERVLLPPEDGHEPDEFEQEFLDEVVLPSPELAQAHWLRMRGPFWKGTRWCRGIDLSQGSSSDVLAQLDLESRWEACLRGRFEGTWHGSLIDLEVFPQKQG